MSSEMSVIIRLTMWRRIVEHKYFLTETLAALDLLLLIYRAVLSRPRPDRESILDVVQEGRSSKLRVSWRASLIVPTCNKL